ncbi:hypothetical protein ACFX1S_035227 [Malus domestica]
MRAPVWNRKNEDDAEDVVDGELLNPQQTTSCQHSLPRLQPRSLSRRQQIPLPLLRARHHQPRHFGQPIPVTHHEPRDSVRNRTGAGGGAPAVRM